MWDNLRQQLASASPGLRLGLLGIVVILWVHGLLLLDDRNTVLRDELQQARETTRRLEAASRERAWPARAEEARKQLAALRALQWTDSELGLVEAAFQDWARSTATSAGLAVRDLGIARGRRAPAAASAAGGAAAGEPAQTLRARLVADLQRDPLIGFLSELDRSARAVVVERALLRLHTTPPQVELDLRLLAQVRPPAAAASGAAR